MLDDFVEAKRGGICGIMLARLVKSRRSRFANCESNKILCYRDENNLYGYAMTQKLPC